MTCQGCSNTSSASNEMLRDEHVMAAFNAFWPRSAAFPPAMPWLGALLSRSGAYYWLSAFPDTAKSLAQAPSYQTIAGFVSWSLTSEAADGEREKRCKRQMLKESDSMEKQKSTHNVENNLINIYDVSENDSEKSDSTQRHQQEYIPVGDGLDFIRYIHSDDFTLCVECGICDVNSKDFLESLGLACSNDCVSRGHCYGSMSSFSTLTCSANCECVGYCA